jgi:hypothetical protein
MKAFSVDVLICSEREIKEIEDEFCCSWRTLAYREEILRIGPLGKRGHFESTAEFFFVYSASISLASGPILSITSGFAKVLHELLFLHILISSFNTLFGLH